MGDGRGVEEGMGVGVGVAPGSVLASPGSGIGSPGSGMGSPEAGWGLEEGEGDAAASSTYFDSNRPSTSTIRFVASRESALTAEGRKTRTEYRVIFKRIFQFTNSRHRRQLLW